MSSISHTLFALFSTAAAAKQTVINHQRPFVLHVRLCTFWARVLGIWLVALPPLMYGAQLEELKWLDASDDAHHAINSNKLQLFVCFCSSSSSSPLSWSFSALLFFVHLSIVVELLFCFFLNASGGASEFSHARRLFQFDLHCLSVCVVDLWTLCFACVCVLCALLFSFFYSFSSNCFCICSDLC